MAPPPCNRAPTILFRAAAVIALSAIAAGCNLPQPSATERPATEAGGQYASEQQALDQSGGALPSEMAGCDDATWYVCFLPDLTIKWWSPPGEVRFSPKPGSEECVAVQASRTGGGRGTLQIAIDGKAEDDDVACTIKGRTTVNLFVGYQCEGSPDRGALHISLKQQWGPAPATLSCTSKHEGGHALSDSLITLGTLGEQTDQMTLKLQLGDAGECKVLSLPAGPILGSLTYCLWSHTAYEPAVPVE